MCSSEGRSPGDNAKGVSVRHGEAGNQESKALPCLHPPPSSIFVFLGIRKLPWRCVSMGLFESEKKKKNDVRLLPGSKSDLADGFDSKDAWSLSFIEFRTCYPQIR